MKTKQITERYLKLRAAFLRVIMMTAFLFMLISGFVLFLFAKLRLLPFLLGNPFLWLLSFYVFCLLIATVLTVYVGRTILTPIEQLSEASKRVAEGDFSVRIDQESTAEELHTTFDNFNAMVKELGSIESLRNDFVANVSHEFKTPLSAIEGYAMLLQDEGLSAEETSEYSNKIILNTKRLSDLTGHILLISKLENQHEEPTWETYRLDEQIREAIVMTEAAWSEKELDFVLDDLPDTVIGQSRSLLSQVWSNLIGNAIKFSERGGTVTVSIQPTPVGGYAVTVTDTGVGMSEETQKHMFEKFYQGDTSHRGAGNGLGLALCRTVVQKCGGEIRVRSALGKGSSFTVVLPDRSAPSAEV